MVCSKVKLDMTKARQLIMNHRHNHSTSKKNMYTRKHANKCYFINGLTDSKRLHNLPICNDLLTDEWIEKNTSASQHARHSCQKMDGQKTQLTNDKWSGRNYPIN